MCRHVLDARQDPGWCPVWWILTGRVVLSSGCGALALSIPVSGLLWSDVVASLRAALLRSSRRAHSCGVLYRLIMHVGRIMIVQQAYFGMWLSHEELRPAATVESESRILRKRFNDVPWLIGWNIQSDVWKLVMFKIYSLVMYISTHCFNIIE